MTLECTVCSYNSLSYLSPKLSSWKFTYSFASAYARITTIAELNSSTSVLHLSLGKICRVDKSNHTCMLWTCLTQNKLSTSHCILATASIPSLKILAGQRKGNCSGYQTQIPTTSSVAGGSNMHLSLSISLQLALRFYGVASIPFSSCCSSTISKC